MRTLISVLLTLALGMSASADEKTTKILLIGKDRDHAFSQHEYMADCGILAKCLKQTKGIEATVSQGWPRDQALLKDVKAIAFNTRMGGDVLFDPLVAAQGEHLLKQGVGIVAIHWGTGAEKKNGERWLNTLGGWFNHPLHSEYYVDTTMLEQAEPKHPICNGWKEFKLREEYYIKLKFMPEAKMILKANVKAKGAAAKEYPVAWVYERPDGGRSFGFVGGHFHDNFGIKEFRQAIVNGILWSARVEVPADGAPVAITDKDLVLPPDERKAKGKK